MSALSPLQQVRELHQSLGKLSLHLQLQPLILNVLVIPVSTSITSSEEVRDNL